MSVLGLTQGEKNILIHPVPFVSLTSLPPIVLCNRESTLFGISLSFTFVFSRLIRMRNLWLRESMIQWTQQLYNRWIKIFYNWCILFDLLIISIFSMSVTQLLYLLRATIEWLSLPWLRYSLRCTVDAEEYSNDNERSLSRYVSWTQLIGYIILRPRLRIAFCGWHRRALNAN